MKTEESKKPKRRRGRAPGRRLILLNAKNKKEALLILKLMKEQIENNCSDNGHVIQSFYLDKNGTGWFG